MPKVPVPLTIEYLAALAAESPRRATVCKRCGKGDLQWVFDPNTGKWYLLGVAKNGNLYRHKCSAITVEGYQFPKGKVKFVKFKY